VVGIAVSVFLSAINEQLVIITGAGEAILVAADQQVVERAGCRGKPADLQDRCCAKRNND
jgi:hypothetical protein